MDTPAAERLRLTEIFLSVQGEARAVGWPTVFVRLTGCPLRCQYCDTAYAFHGGEWWEIDAILAEVASHGVRHVCVTGGEPLAQKRCLGLLEKLCDAGYEVSLEMHRNLLSNLPLLTAHDQVKFVICDRADYEWARGMVAEHGLVARCEVLFSPSFDQVAPRELAEWILADKLPVRFQMQLHKQLWGDAQGR
jgi:7-carboxy-7-deazaguanine synthase